MQRTHRRRRTSVFALGLVATLGLAAAAGVARADSTRYWPPIADPATGTWSPGRIACRPLEVVLNQTG